MQRKFITNLFFLLFLNILIKPFWILGIDRAVQNEVGAGAYGLYAALFNFSFLFNILLDVGITNFNNRNIAQNNQLISKHFPALISLRMVLAALYLTVSLLVALLLGYRGQDLNLLWILLLNQAILSFILYLRSNLAGLHLFRTDSFISVLDRLIMISICAFLLWYPARTWTFTIEWFAWIQTFAYSITAIITFFMVASRARWQRFHWNKHFFYIILKKSYPFAILILLMTFYNRIDSVMLERMLDDGDEQAGIYAQAYRLLDSANMIAYLFSVLLLPIFSQMIRQHKSVENLAELSFSLLAVPAIALICFSFFYAQELMSVLYVSHTEESSAVFRVIIGCFLAMGSVYVFGTMLTANGNLSKLNRLAAAGMVMNIVLNFILIPRYKAQGAAWAGLVTQFITAAWQIALAHKTFGMTFRLNLALRYVVFAAGCALIFYAMDYFQLSWLNALLFGATGVTAWAFLLFLIRPRELRRLILDTENE